MKYEIAMLKSEVGGSRLGQLSYEHLQEPYPEQCRVDTYTEQLECQGFVQIHKSYLVNMKYISVIEKDSVVMTNQRSIPLSRHRKKEVKERYRQYRRG